MRDMKKLVKQLVKEQEKKTEGSLQESKKDDKVPKVRSDELRGERCHEAAVMIQANWRGRLERQRVSSELKSQQLEGRIRNMEQQMSVVTHENAALRQALVEESRRRMIQEEALRSLWEEVQHLQSWAEQVSDGQEMSFDRSQMQMLRESPSRVYSPDSTADSKQKMPSGDSVTYF